MVKYTLIGYEDDVFFEDYVEGDDLFICEKCFKTFRNRSITHLSECDMNWPYNSTLCSSSKIPTLMIYKLDEEKDTISKRIVKAICNLARFSKNEQGIDG